MGYKPSHPSMPPLQDDHGQHTRQIAEYDRWVYRLANQPDGGTGHVTLRIGTTVYAWRWYDGVVGRARGRWRHIVEWKAGRDLRAGLWRRKSYRGQ